MVSRSERGEPSVRTCSALILDFFIVSYWCSLAISYVDSGVQLEFGFAMDLSLIEVRKKI